MFNLKFSWGFSWNQFFGASKIARSWALYLESDLGVVLSDSPEGQLVWVSQIFQDSACQTEKKLPKIWELKITGEWSVCDFYSISTRSKRKKQKSLSFFLWCNMPNLESHGCARGECLRIPGDEQRHRDLHLHRELSWSAGDSDFFRWRLEVDDKIKL